MNYTITQLELTTYYKVGKFINLLTGYKPPFRLKAMGSVTAVPTTGIGYGSSGLSHNIIIHTWLAKLEIK